jgi:hypothetical protein
MPHIVINLVFIDRLEDVITRAFYVGCCFVIQAEVEMAVKPASLTLFLPNDKDIIWGAISCIKLVYATHDRSRVVPNR